MKIVLIRHGMTEGNVSRRYIGITDENLCPKGQEILNENIKNRKYPMADIVFSSTMKRCVQTAKIIYPEKDILKEELLKECDFGIFEGKNYMELSDEPLYQQWIDSGGSNTFPGGENPYDFRKRSVEGFYKCMDFVHRMNCEDKKIETVAFVVHGGTIMSVMSNAFGGDYYDYSCLNGSGYILECKFDENNLLHYSGYCGLDS